MASQYDLTIIGGGILGLATALKITAAHPNIKVLLLEKEAQLARHQTGNNSGVIHSGPVLPAGIVESPELRRRPHRAHGVLRRQQYSL